MAYQITGANVPPPATFVANFCFEVPSCDLPISPLPAGVTGTWHFAIWLDDGVNPVTLWLANSQSELDRLLALPEATRFFIVADAQSQHATTPSVVGNLSPYVVHG